MTKVLLIVFFGVFGASCALNALSQSDVQQQRSVEKEGFKLKISKLRSLPLLMAPSHYRIDFCRDGKNWQMVTKWSQDDPWPVADIDMNVLDSKVAYYFNMVKYGVTTDSGNSWHTFDFYARSISDHLETLADHKVPRVKIHTNGMGVIYTQDYKDRTAPTTTIYETSDYGKTWLKEMP